MADHDRGKWVELYKTAVFELEQSLMAGRIANARAGNRQTGGNLTPTPGAPRNGTTAIDDALNNLRFLEREDAQITEKRKKAELALERLHLLNRRSNDYETSASVAGSMQGRTNSFSSSSVSVAASKNSQDKSKPSLRWSLTAHLEGSDVLRAARLAGSALRARLMTMQAIRPLPVLCAIVATPPCRPKPERLAHPSRRFP